MDTSEKLLLNDIRSKTALLAILIDPDKVNFSTFSETLKHLPAATTHLFVGGSTAEEFQTDTVVKILKEETHLPVVIFPGDYTQITQKADALLFLSLFSGRNPEFLIEQQVKSVSRLKNSTLEIIPTAYLLIDGGKESAVQQVSQTQPMPQENIEAIVNTALAAEFSGKQLIYLEAGSGAKNPISTQIISEVKKTVHIPVIVGGGIKSAIQLEKAYRAGADLVVVGTAFEENSVFLENIDSNSTCI